MAFIPEIEKTFPYKAGDILLYEDPTRGHTVVKILAYDRLEVTKGKPVHIAGHEVIPPSDDWFLVVYVAMWNQFNPAAITEMAYKDQLHQWDLPLVPTRPGTFYGRAKKIGQESIDLTDLQHISKWRAEWNRGHAGVY